MYKGSNTMIAVDNFDFTSFNHSDNRGRDSIVVADKLCTCPKPLLTPSHACEHCWQTFYASLENGVDAEARRIAEKYGLKVDVD